MPYWLDSLLSSPFVLIGAAVVLLVTVAWLLLARQPHTFRAFDTQEGEVLVTRKAVRELVQRCCEELGDVGSATAKVRLSGDTLHVHVGLRIKRSANLKGISGYLREQISQALTEILGIEKIGEIAIVVVGILEDSDVEAS